jgi:ABC-2 type transport system permease protein
MTAAADLTTAPSPLPPAARLRPAGAAARSAFAALLLRDLTVLRKNLKEFIPRTIIQPLLLVFVFTYVFPKIGQGVGGSGAGAAQFSTLLVAGVVALSVVFQGIQAVGLPLVQEFGYTKEIEDRVLAPLPVAMVAVGKIVAGALQGLFAAVIVFPVAAFVPATPVHLHVNWPVLITITPLACITSAALGLTFGTRIEPRSVPVLFGIIIVPLTFLGAIYYPWARLSPIPWLKYGVLVNPLVYMSEGFRAALVNRVPHMSLLGVYAALIGFAALLTAVGIQGFRKRVLA